MKAILFRWTFNFLFLPAVISTFLWPVNISQAQESLALPEWKVYMKVSPCAGSLIDWMTVASEPPAHGSGFYQPARSPTLPISNSFERTPAGFAAAHIRADFLRILGITVSGETGQIAKYDNYCCHDWTVWRNQQTDGSIRFSATRGQATPGMGWVQEKGGLCCEHAAAFAGFVGGCGDFTLSTGQVVRFTGNGFVHLGAGPVTVEDIVIPPSDIAPPMPGPTGNMEFNIDRPGQDFQNFDLQNADPAVCKQACDQNPSCKAWTYVNPNMTQGPNPRCWLKTGVPNPLNSTCCVSGVKGGSSDGSKCPPGTIELLGVCSAPGPSGR
ncbi:MAG: PAN domain-containing protein [Methylococcaceae bacterium]